MQSTTEFESLHPNLVEAERVSAWIFIGIMASVGLLIWIFLGLVFFGVGDWRCWIIGLGITCLIGVVAWLCRMEPVWRIKTTKLREIRNGLELHRGYIWHHRIFIPRERIQHTDIVQGPISRRFGIASLVINTAGTENHQITIEGLAMERAEELRASLLPRSHEKTIDHRAESPTTALGSVETDASSSNVDEPPQPSNPSAPEFTGDSPVEGKRPEERIEPTSQSTDNSEVPPETHCLVASSEPIQAKSESK